jgi:hypothetical protein
MGGDRGFWTFFGGIFLVVGIAFVALSLGINVFADPDQGDGLPRWVFALVGVVAAAGGAGVIYVARQAATRDRRLMETGTTITATVTDVRRSRVEINRQSRWLVSYRYEYSKGRMFEGSSRAMTADQVSGFKPGDAVRIKVDPAKPEDSLFVGPMGSPAP